MKIKALLGYEHTVANLFLPMNFQYCTSIIENTYLDLINSYNCFIQEFILSK